MIYDLRIQVGALPRNRLRLAQDVPAKFVGGGEGFYDPCGRRYFVSIQPLRNCFPQHHVLIQQVVPVMFNGGELLAQGVDFAEQSIFIHFPYPFNAAAMTNIFSSTVLACSF